MRAGLQGAGSVERYSAWCAKPVPRRLQRVQYSGYLWQRNVRVAMPTQTRPSSGPHRPGHHDIAQGGLLSLITPKQSDNCRGSHGTRDMILVRHRRLPPASSAVDDVHMQDYFTDSALIVPLVGKSTQWKVYATVHASATTIVHSELRTTL